MSTKKSSDTKSSTPSTSSPALKIGSRVRCTDDGVEERIVWGNAVAVKIRWDDDEQITWRRDSLASRPIEILEADGGENPSASALEPIAREQTDRIEPPQTEPEAAHTTSTTEQVSPHPEPPVAEPSDEPTATTPVSTEQHSEPAAEPLEAPVAVAAGMTPVADALVGETSTSEPAQQEQQPPEQTEEQPRAITATAKQPRTQKLKGVVVDGREKKLSALDAAAKVLAETAQAMNRQEMIAAMAAKGYWTSPGGKTPATTLYPAILREITTKGAASRFVKAERGKFARSGAV
jgi:hypothetical protein